MKIRYLTPLLILTLPLGLQAKGKAWTEPKTAAKEDPDFLVQGEYGENNGKSGLGIQVVALGGGKFQAAVYKGGLPGAGAKDNKFDLYKGETSDGKVVLSGPDNAMITIINGNAKGKGFSYKKISRESPTIGQEAPKGATVLFDGKTNEFNPGKSRGQYLAEGQITKD